MKFPTSTPLLLLLHSRVFAANAFLSPTTKLSNVQPQALSFIKRNIPPRGGQSPRPFNTDNNNGNSNRGIENLALQVSVSTDGETPTSQPSKEEDDHLSDIEKAAISSRSITGSSTHMATFADGTSFVNTEKLTEKKQHRVLFILGGPGAGKGTQSERIVNTYKCIHLSVGELLREERARGAASPHAELIEECLVAGQIVPVEISLNLVRNAMDEKSSSYGQPIFLVDGFPRNFDNLSGWTKEMPNYASVIGSLVYDCPIDVLEQRILGRAATSGRSDDNLESARKRFNTFQTQTMPVVYSLEEVEKMEEEEMGMSTINIQHIVGEGTVEEVWDETKAAMDGFLRNDILTANSALIQAIEEKDMSVYSKLCSVQMFQGKVDDDTDDDEEMNDNAVPTSSQIEQAFQQYEIVHGGKETVSKISNSNVEIQNGTKAVVSYDRRIEDVSGKLFSEFRESRVWSHEAKGWTCVHFIRKPLSEQ